MPVQIQFGDRSRELKFNLRAVKDLEANLDGKPLGAVMHMLAQLGVTAITVALWAGLKHEDKALNPNLVTKMLEDYIAKGGRIKKLADALSEALDETGLFRTDDDSGEDDDEGNGKAA